MYNQVFADDLEIENTCKPEGHSALENNINIDPSRLKSYFDTNKLSINITINTLKLLYKCYSIATFWLFWHDLWLWLWNF